MELPEFITRLPEAALPFSEGVVKTNVLPSAHGQLVFFQVLADMDLPPHSHKAQWGTVLEGRLSLTIGGVTREVGPGDSYYIPAGVVHSARVPAGVKLIELFEEPDRWKLRATGS